MKNKIIAALIVMILIVIVILMYPNNGATANLKIYSGAGLRRAVEALTSEFEKRSGIKVEADYGGSGIVLSKVQLDDEADLFLPGDISYVNKLQEKTNNVTYQAEISYFIPTIIVRKDNPKNIKGLADFAREDICVALGTADSCQIGKLAKKLFAKNGIDMSKIVPKESLTVNELGTWVQMNDVDASIVWCAIASNIKKDVNIIKIPSSENIISRVVLAQLKTSKYPLQARKFIDFVTSKDGQEILKKRGFTTSLSEGYINK